jgi:hypothetical protein
LGLPLCVEPFLMVWQEPHLGQRNIEAGESFVRRLCSKSSSPSNQNLIIPEKILIKTAIIKSKLLNHKKQILDIYQVIIFISQYSTQLRLDKQESYATTIGSLPFFLLKEIK